MLVEELHKALEIQSGGVIGLANKQELLKRLIENEEFYKGDIDTSNHKSDCGQCHEFDFLFGWIGRGVSLLKSLEEHNGTEPKAEPPATATSRNGRCQESLI